MLSYIVALLAALIFLGNPILQAIYPASQRHQQQQHGGNKRRPLSPVPPQLDQSLLAIDLPNATAPSCPEDAHVAHILRRQPLVVYFENFVSEAERRHLLDISDPLWQPSTVTNDGRTAGRDAAVRDSLVAVVPRTDGVRCIERRAVAAQGWRRDVWIERLRTQRYVAPSGHYSHHFDWGTAHAGAWGRVSSFMVWLDDGRLSGDGEGLEGGGTEFPLLEWRGEKEWCEFVECNKDEAEGDEAGGVTFRVKPGNAVYWENFNPEGRGYDETWHAGLPVTKGSKVGLNIWSFGRIE